jgi:hypothetical protein
MYKRWRLNNFIHIGIVPILLRGEPFLRSLLKGNSATHTKASTIPLRAVNGIVSEKPSNSVNTGF